MRRDVSFKLVRAIWIPFSAIACVSLSACGDSGDDKASQSITPIQVKKESAPADPTARMARAVPIGGATAPVNLKYDVLSKPIVGTPVEIELAVMPTQHADSMSVSMAGSPGLTLSLENVPSGGVVKSGHIEKVRFTALADKEAVYYVTVTATLYTAGTSEVRNFALPLIVTQPGSTAAATAAPPKKT